MTTSAEQTPVAQAPAAQILTQSPGVASHGISRRAWALIAPLAPIAAALIALFIDRFIPNREHPAARHIYSNALLIAAAVTLALFAAHFVLRPLRSWLVFKGPILAAGIVAISCWDIITRKLAQHFKINFGPSIQIYHRGCSLSIPKLVACCLREIRRAQIK